MQIQYSKTITAKAAYESFITDISFRSLSDLSIEDTGDLELIFTFFIEDVYLYLAICESIAQTGLDIMPKRMTMSFMTMFVSDEDIKGFLEHRVKTALKIHVDDLQSISVKSPTYERIARCLSSTTETQERK